MLYFKLFVCTFYGIVSIAQTLNSRFLFKQLHFQFYSTVFLLQRIVIIAIYWRNSNLKKISCKEFMFITPYAFIMCSINILSSYCVAIMPLAAFMAFKKFVVFFVLLVGLLIGIRNNFRKVHYWCIASIVGGGLLIGERDIFRGEFLGYFSSLVYTLLEAISLQYAVYMYQQKNIGPKADLIVANSVISLPYYIFFMFWQNEPVGIAQYLQEPISSFLPEAILLTIVLAFASEYTANTISMKISPFEKASVSNIKDLILTLVSIKYYKDINLNWISQIGIIFCLAASLVFSFTLIDQPREKDISQQQETYSIVQSQISESFQDNLDIQFQSHF